MGQRRRKEGKAKEGCAKTRSSYGKTSVSGRVALSVHRSLL